jgi:hypothetical protein
LRPLKMLAVAAALVVAAGCGTEPGTAHWRKAGPTPRQTFVMIRVPATNQYGSQGIVGTPVEGYIRDAVAAWNAHPDLQVTVTFGDTPGCPGNNVDNDKPNCFYVFRVPNSALSDGVAGQAIWFSDGTHFSNGPGPRRPNSAHVEVAADWAGQPENSERNAYCHEIGHMWDLGHPTDGSPGPCNGQGVVDADDNAALDKTIDACHSDPAPAPRASTEAYTGSDDCGGVSQPEPAGSGAVKRIVVEDSFATFAAAARSSR